jgi:hypothetical protein
VDECSVLRSIKKLLRNDYKNAVVVTSVDRAARIIKSDPANTWWRAKVRASFICHELLPDIFHLFLFSF